LNDDAASRGVSYFTFVDFRRFSMFQVLEQLVRSAGKLSMTLRMDGDQMVIVAIPQADGKDKEAALRQPLVLTGSPAELDAGFAEALTSYAGARRSLAEQVAATTAIIEAAEKSQAGKAQKAIAKGSKSAAPKASTPAGSPEGEGDESEDSNDRSEEPGQSGPPADATATGRPTGTDMSSLLNL
jgi:PRTRC genetic system protein E